MWKRLKREWFDRFLNKDVIRTELDGRGEWCIDTGLCVDYQTSGNNRLPKSKGAPPPVPPRRAVKEPARIRPLSQPVRR